MLLLSIANAVAVFISIPVFRPMLPIVVPPFPLLPSENLLKLSFDRIDGLVWDLANEERLFPLKYPFVNVIDGLLFDAENQSSIGDAFELKVSMKFSLVYPFDFGVEGDRDASEPIIVCSLYLVAAADSR